MGIMEKKMETTTVGYTGFHRGCKRVNGLGFRFMVWGLGFLTWLVTLESTLSCKHLVHQP